MADHLAAGEHEFDTSQNNILHYTVSGNGPLLIVIPPAWGVGSRYLRVGLQPLEQFFTLICIEPRGNGGSTRPDPSEMTSWHIADDIEALRVHLGLDKVERLMGHSNGGAIALWYATKYPDRVGKLVLLNSHLEGYDDSVATNELVQKKRGDPRFVSGIEAFTGKLGKPETDEEFGVYLSQLLPLYFAHPDLYFEEVKSLFPTNPTLWNRERLYPRPMWDLQQEHLLHEEMGKVQAETLLIYGAEDVACSVNQGRVTQELISGSRLVVYEDDGHFPWWEHQEAFLADVLRFFGQKHEFRGILEATAYSGRCV